MLDAVHDARVSQDLNSSVSNLRVCCHHRDSPSKYGAVV